MLIGYARVSTQDQDAAAQIAVLKTSGSELIFQEKASGGRWDRPELHRLLGQLRIKSLKIVMVRAAYFGKLNQAECLTG